MFLACPNREASGPNLQGRSGFCAARDAFSDKAILKSGGFSMKNKALLWAMPAAAVLALAVGQGAIGQESKLPGHFSGLIDDYTPSTVKGGPYEMHGKWSLDLHGYGSSVTAHFSASLNMETSDYGTANGNVNPAFPTTRGAHTHDIELTGPVQFDATGCPTSIPAVPAPASPPPLTTTGFQFTGTVSLITANGSQAPFEPAPPSPPTSMLTVCVTGGPEVGYSNVTLVFGAPASNHFGTQAIHGVVRKTDFAADEGGHPW
jgi:hypothetical protein